MIDVKIKKSPLNVAKYTQKATNPASGGTAIFVGSVRNQTNGRKVLRLEFETYPAMALKELTKVAATASERWPISDILIHHREGVVQVGQPAVVIIVSSAHREAAFKACRYAIDTLKQTVPIWKKEFFEDGSQWVTPHP